MCPVDFVARLVVASVMNSSTPLVVVQCTSHPRLRFNEYLGMLQTCGYNVPKVNSRKFSLSRLGPSQVRER